MRWHRIAVGLTILVGLALLATCGGCAVGWQINMPMAYSQAHSRGTSYNAADAKQMDISGTSEAFQQQRASAGNDALTAKSDQAKATDLATAKGQAQQTTETAKAQEQGTAQASGNQTPTATPTKTTSIAPQANVAPGGLAVGAQKAPAASPGTNTATPTGSLTAPAVDPATMTDAQAAALLKRLQAAQAAEDAAKTATP